ncbi:MAG: DUF417 family protein [Polyangiaceae bacterium]
MGSLLAAGTFLVTLSFLVTTPGAFSPENPMGGFLMKDLILLGAALFTAGEALAAAPAGVEARARAAWMAMPTPMPMPAAAVTVSEPTRNLMDSVQRGPASVHSTMYEQYRSNQLERRVLQYLRDVHAQRNSRAFVPRNDAKLRAELEATQPALLLAFDDLGFLGLIELGTLLSPHDAFRITELGLQTLADDRTLDWRLPVAHPDAERLH